MTKVTRILEDRLCDGCSRRLAFAEVTRSDQESFLRPLDFCSTCLVTGTCEACLRDSVQVAAGNCLPCWGRALTKPRGECKKTASWFLGGDANRGHRRHACTLLNNHPGETHTCTCGILWVGGRNSFRRSMLLQNTEEPDESYP